MRLIGLDTMPEDGRRRGALRGTVGTTTTPGIGIRGTGTIRSTIAHGMVGVHPSTTLYGMALDIMATMATTVPGIAEDTMLAVVVRTDEQVSARIKGQHHQRVTLT